MTTLLIWVYLMVSTMATDDSGDTGNNNNNNQNTADYIIVDEVVLRGGK